MHRVAQGIEKRSDAQRNERPEADDIRSGDLHELGEGAILVQAENLRSDADVTVARAALKAGAAGDVHLRGNILPDLELFAAAALADGLDESAELVSVDARWANGIANRRIPAIDVLVRSADGRGSDADQHLVGAGLGNGTVANLRSGHTINRRGLDDGLHQQ